MFLKQKKSWFWMRLMNFLEYPEIEINHMSGDAYDWITKEINQNPEYKKWFEKLNEG